MAKIIFFFALSTAGSTERKRADSLGSQTHNLVNSEPVCKHVVMDDGSHHPYLAEFS